MAILAVVLNTVKPPKKQPNENVLKKLASDVEQ
jgi:hypothetical protein